MKTAGFFLAALLPLLGAVQAAAPTRASLTGAYEGNQMEVGAQLTLKPDGHFDYELAYGAMDETAAGTWDIRDGSVSLTTVPAVKLPQFVVVSDKSEPKGGLWIKLKPLMEGTRQRVILYYGPGEEPDITEIADDGHVTLPGGRWPTAISPEIPVYPILPAPIPLTGAAGHRLTLRFEPNNIGKADFRGTMLPIKEGTLVMTRKDIGLILKFQRKS